MARQTKNLGHHNTIGSRARVNDMRVLLRIILRPRAVWMPKNSGWAPSKPRFRQTETAAGIAVAILSTSLPANRQINCRQRARFADQLMTLIGIPVSFGEPRNPKIRLDRARLLRRILANSPSNLLKDFPATDQPFLLKDPRSEFAEAESSASSDGHCVQSNRR